MSADSIDLPQLLAARGSVRLPGSKSISNRLLLLSALAVGETELRDLLHSDDTARMLDALQALGVPVETLADDVYRVRGTAGNLPVRSASLFLGNAGTAFRSLTAMLALAGGYFMLSGVPRMHQRPIGDLVDGLRQLGANIEYAGAAGYPPLRISPPSPPATGGTLVRLRGDVSSQFLSGLLMALPLSGVATAVEMSTELISRPYVEMTLALMARFGVVVEREGWQRFTVPAGSVYRSPGVVHVEGDASSASYFLALGAIAGGPLRVKGVGRDSVQGDVLFADALAAMGAQITYGDHWIEASIPRDAALHGLDLDANHIPDAAMTLATVAPFANGPTTLRNIASWRVKETDRLAAMAKELRKLSVEVEEGADYIRIHPPAAGLSPAIIDTYDDHRMAMCFSLLTCGTPLRINDPATVGKTFPDYFACFARLAQTVPVLAIDGLSASGKGTVATRVAAVLGWHYLDSGALYRLTALAAQRAGLAWDDEHAVAALAATLDVHFIDEQILLAGEDVSDAIRSEEISTGASRVAALPAVRSALLFRQRAFRRSPGLVADGRDMGSTVFPDARCKVFLTASVEKRAERRYKQLLKKGIAVSMADLLLDLRARDERDSQRSVAPMRQTEDAELLDTTSLTIDIAVQQVLDWVRQTPEDR